MLECQLRISENNMEMTKSQLRMGAHDLVICETKMNSARKWLVAAAKVFTTCSLIALSIEVFGGALSARHCSIVAGIGGGVSMVSAESCVSRQGHASSKLDRDDFVVYAPRTFQETRNTRARILNGITLFDVRRNTIFGNRRSGAKTLARSPFGHEGVAHADFVVRILERLHLHDCATSGANFGSPGKLLQDCEAKVCRFNSSDLLMADPAAKLTMANASTIYLASSDDEIIADRHRLKRERTTNVGLETNTTERQMTGVNG
jgi:hypothetical protein